MVAFDPDCWDEAVTFTVDCRATLVAVLVAVVLGAVLLGAVVVGAVVLVAVVLGAVVVGAVVVDAVVLGALVVVLGAVVAVAPHASNSARPTFSVLLETLVTWSWTLVTVRAVKLIVVALPSLFN